jgi:hypothetical protein
MAGLCGIIPYYLQKGIKCIIASLYKIYRACLTYEHIYYYSLERSKGCLHDKSRKDNYTDSNPFMLITFTFIEDYSENDWYLGNNILIKFPCINISLPIRQTNQLKGHFTIVVRRKEETTHKKISLEAFLGIEIIFSAIYHGVEFTS